MAAAAHARGNPHSKPGSGGSQPPTGGGGGAGGSATQQRLQGAFLTIIGLAGAVGGVLFAIEAPKYTPVPVVFLTFWLVMVIVGQVLFAGLRKLRAAGVGAPAPEQVRGAAAVAAIVVAVGMMGFAATTAGTGSVQAAPCPGGGPATCGPTPGQPELTFTPPAGQQTAPGGQQGQQGAQQGSDGIATSPAGSGGENGPGIQAQTPDFGTPGQPTPNIPGNEPDQPTQQPGQGQGQQQQGNQQQQNPVQTTAAGRPQQGQQTSQQTQSGQASPSQPTVTITQTQSQCPAPAAPGAGGQGAPGGGGDASGPGAGPDGGDSEDGAPSWAYLVGETSALLTGRRRSPSRGGTPAGSTDNEADASEPQNTSDGAADSAAEGSEPATDDDSEGGSDGDPGDSDDAPGTDRPQSNDSDQSQDGAPEDDDRNNPDGRHGPEARDDQDRQSESGTTDSKQEGKPFTAGSAEKDFTRKPKPKEDENGRPQRDSRGRTQFEDPSRRGEQRPVGPDRRTDASKPKKGALRGSSGKIYAGEDHSVRGHQERYDLPGNGKGETDFGRLGGSAGVEAKDGQFRIGAAGAADAVRTENKWSNGAVSGSVGVEGSAGAEFGKDGVGAGVDAFAGGKVGVSGTTNEYAGIKFKGGADARFGVGAGAGAGYAKQPDGSYQVYASLGAAAGPGAKVSGAIEVNPDKLMESASNAGEAVVDGAKSTASKVGEAAKDAASSVKKGVSKAWNAIF